MRRGQAIIYIAGLVDSRGSVIIHKHSMSPYVLVLMIYHKEKSILEFIQDFFKAGKIYPDRKGYQLRFGADKSKEILKSLLPYLRVKKEQAELAIKFQTKKKRQRPLTDEELAFRKRCYEEMKALKKR